MRRVSIRSGTSTAMSSATLYKFSERSLARLDECDPRLQRILKEAIRHVDFSILEGHRDERRQNRMYDEGRSKLRWPDSKHNKTPSLAVDLAPHPLDWGNLARFAHLAGMCRGIASQMGIKLRWGGDWDRDGELSDNRFNDLPHLELDD